MNIERQVMMMVKCKLTDNRRDVYGQQAYLKTQNTHRVLINCSVMFNNLEVKRWPKEIQSIGKFLKESQFNGDKTQVNFIILFLFHLHFQIILIELKGGFKINFYFYNALKETLLYTRF